MLNLTIGTNTSRKKVIVDETDTLRAILESNNVNINVGTIHINGEVISRDNLDCTLEELEVSDQAFIIVAAKADNAKN